MLAHAVFILAGIFVLTHGKHFLIETEDKDDFEPQDTSNNNDYQDIPAEGIVKNQHQYATCFRYFVYSVFFYILLCCI